MPFRRPMGVLLAASVGLSGCHQPRFMTQVDHAYYNKISGERRDQPADPTLDAVAAVRPPTVEDFGRRTPRALTLGEAKRLALGNNKQIALLAWAPGQRGTAMDRQLAAFDAAYGFGGQWGRSERQISNQAQGNGSDAQLVNSFGQQAGGFGQNATSGGPTDGGGALPALNLFNLQKRNATGGTTGIGYSIDYTRQNPAGFTTVNPSWNSTLGLTMEQPLLQGAGVEFNRAPILIARTGFEQSIREFDARVRELLRDAELAYWQLYAAYRTKHSRETAMEILLKTWRNQVERESSGKIAMRDVSRTREDYERAKGQLIAAQQDILTAELQLRRLCGLPPSDGQQLTPADAPSEARYQPDWTNACRELHELRPELSGQRLAVRAAELELQRQKNGLLPDLTVGGNYALTGLDNQYDQSLNRLFSNRYATWGLFFRVTRPIGERAAHAETRRAQMALSEQHARMRALEDQFQNELTQAYQDLSSSYARIAPVRATAEALRQEVKADQAQLDVGRINVDEMVASVTRLSQAESDEAAVLVGYSQALVRWEFAKGTILRNDNVQLAEEVCSGVCDSIRERVRRQLACAWTLPTHPGTAPHADTTECPDQSLPLYKATLDAAPAVAPAPPAAVAPAEAPKTGKPTGDAGKPAAATEPNGKRAGETNAPAPMVPAPVVPAPVVPAPLPPAAQPLPPLTPLAPPDRVETARRPEALATGWNAIPPLK